MATYAKFEVWPENFVDVNGDPYAAGTLTFVATGTSTPAAVYSDDSGTALSNGFTVGVVNLNSRGVPETAGGTVCEIYGDTSVIYDMILKDAAGSTVDTYDKIAATLTTTFLGYEIDSVASLYGNDWSHLEYATTVAFIDGGSTGGTKWYKNGNGGTQTTAGTLNTDLGNGYVVDAGGNYFYMSPGQLFTPAMYGALQGGADDSTAIELCASANSSIYLDADYTFSSITLSGSLSFSGPGSLIGLAPSGSKPTRAAIKAAGSSASRLALLEAYYNAEITFGSSCTINGILTVKNCLFTGGSASYLSVSGYLELDDCSLHNAGFYASGSGYIKSSDDCIISDSPARAVYLTYGGTAYLPDCVISSASSEGIYFNTGGNCNIGGGFVDDCGGAAVLSNYGGNFTATAPTFDGNSGYALAAESGGQFYAINATITNNGGGIFTQYGGATIQATGSTITGNTLLAVDARGTSVVNVLTATIDTTNNSGGTQVRALQGAAVYAEEPGVGSGKTALSSSDYDPPYNITGHAGSSIGETNPSAPGNEIGAIYPKPINCTVASGALTISGYVNAADTESLAASDDIDTISFAHGLNSMGLVYPVSDTRTLVIKNGTGNITTSTAADITLDTDDKGVIITRVGTAVYAIPLF